MSKRAYQLTIFPRELYSLTKVLEEFECRNCRPYNKHQMLRVSEQRTPNVVARSCVSKVYVGVVREEREAEARQRRDGHRGGDEAKTKRSSRGRAQKQGQQ